MSPSDRLLKHRSRQVIARQQFLPKHSWIGLVFILIVVMMFFTQQVQPRIADATRFQLHYVILSVGNADRVSQWYVDKLGFTISDRFVNLVRYAITLRATRRKELVL